MEYKKNEFGNPIENQIRHSKEMINMEMVKLTKDFQEDVVECAVISVAMDVLEDISKGDQEEYLIELLKSIGNRLDKMGVGVMFVRNEEREGLKHEK